RRLAARVGPALRLRAGLATALRLSAARSALAARLPAPRGGRAGGAAQPVAHRHRLHPAHGRGAQARDGARELAALEAEQELREDRAQLEPGDVRAEAHVLAHAEGEVAVRAAVDAEREGVAVHLLVAVRRGVEEGERIAGADLRPAELDVGGRRAREVHHGA